MSYLPDTILTRRFPVDEDDPEFALNRVKVVGGASPIHVSGDEDRWDRMGGERVVVTPLDVFAGPENVPLVYLNAKYEIEEEPELAPTERVVETDPRKARRAQPEMLTPEASLRRQQQEEEKHRATQAVAQATNAAIASTVENAEDDEEF